MFGDLAWYRESDADQPTPVEFAETRTAAERDTDPQAAL